MMDKGGRAPGKPFGVSWNDNFVLIYLNESSPHLLCCYFLCPANTSQLVMPPPPAIPPMSMCVTKLPSTRKSKLMLLGDILRKGVLRSNALRIERGLNVKAEKAILALITDSTEGTTELCSSALRHCREAARCMEEVLFLVGGAERIVCSLRYFKDRPAIREVGYVRKALMESDGDGNSNCFHSKQERMNEAIVKALRGFLGMFSRKGAEGKRDGGRRFNEDQNAYDAVMTALNSNELTGAKLGRMLSRMLNVSHRQIKRGRAMRKNMEDMDKARWVRKRSAVPKNAIGEGED